MPMISRQEQLTPIKTKLFSALAHPIRLRILEEVKNKEKCVSDIAKAIEEASQSQLSNHLLCLKECGLVNSRRDWRNVYYSLSDPKVAQLLDAAEGLLAKVSSRIAACLEITPPNTRRQVR